jgi:hypothetical protein
MSDYVVKHVFPCNKFHCKYLEVCSVISPAIKDSRFRNMDSKASKVEVEEIVKVAIGK